VTSAVQELASALTGDQERKLRRWRQVVRASLLGAGAALLLECVLLLWPGVSRTARLVVAGMFVELMLTSAVVGALGRCPRCNSSFEAPPGELLPERCRGCGAVFRGRP
jgi:hypothetical protein